MPVSSDRDLLTTALLCDALLTAWMDERHLLEDKVSCARDDLQGYFHCNGINLFSATVTFTSIGNIYPYERKSSDSRHPANDSNGQHATYDAFLHWNDGEWKVD